MINKSTFVLNVLVAVLCVAALPTSGQNKVSPKSELSSDEVSRILHASTDSFEMHCPDAIEYAYYHVLDDGSTQSFTKLQPSHYSQDARIEAAVTDLLGVFDSIAPSAVDYDGGRPTVISDQYRRIMNFKRNNERLNRQLELSRRYEDPLYYQQTISIMTFENYFEFSHFWRTEPDSTYTGPADLSDIESEFARILDEYGTQVEKVRFDSDDGYAGALRTRPNRDMHITGTLLCLPLAGASDWVRLYRLMWGHFGDKGQMSFSYNRSRDIFITDYLTKKIYAVSSRNGKLYFMKAIYSDRPFLPNDWRPDR